MKYNKDNKILNNIGYDQKGQIKKSGGLPSTTFCSKSGAGFTLIEVTVSVAVFALLGVGIIALVSNIISTGSQQGVLSANADQARKASFRLMQELRNAVTSSTGAYALSDVSDQQLIFYSNVDGGSDVERVRYYLSAGSLYRGIVKPSGSPLTYNPANEITKIVQDNVANGTTPLFYYYPDSYDGDGNPLSQPVTITQVKIIKLNLQVYNKGGVKNNNFYTVTASGTIRNLKSNLGS